MESNINTNPILPAPGVCRSSATNAEAGPTESLGGHYDDAALNRRRRGVTSDDSRSRGALLRCRSHIKMGTFNANTLRTEYKVAECEQRRNDAGIDILGVQEHRIILQDPSNIEYRTIGSSYFVISSGWRNEAQASQGGVGLLLGKKAKGALLDAKRVNNRILRVEFDGNPKTTVIVIYSPTNSAEESEVEEFYKSLRGTLQDIPAHNFVTILGDFNARIGPEVAAHTYHEATNRNGKYMADLLLEFGLLAANAQFKKRPGKLWTFKDRATESLRQLDYILVRRKWRNSLMDAEAYNSFCTVGSDHRVVCAKIRLSLRTAKHTKIAKYDWKLFSVSPEIQDRYTVAVKNRFHVLEESGDETSYVNFVEANRQAMDECVPTKPRKKTVSNSTNPRVVEARETAEEAHNKWDIDSTDENRTAWKLAVSQLYEIYGQVKEEELEESTRKIEAAYGARQYGEAWRVVNEMSGRKKAKEGQVAGNSPEERVETWFTHFQKLLGEPPTVEDPDEEIPSIYADLDINDGLFTMDEFSKVKASLQLGKAAGPDNIPPEVFKRCDFDEICLDFCNKALLENDKPELWSLMNIIPVPKSGDLSNTNNYRGISLTCILAKMYNRMILNRIRSVIDPKLRTNQNGFRPERTTVAQILTLRRIIEEVKANNLPAIITFIDFKKAFDSIHREKMMRILKAYGIPPKLLRAIEQMYTNTRARIQTPDGETEQFNISAGVLQGDTLAPFLFIIVLDYALRQAMADEYEEKLGFTTVPRRSSRYPKEVLADLDFADDIALLSDDIEKAQELLLRVETECNKVGLCLNGPKTKYLAYNTASVPPLSTRSSAVLERKNDFKYLGSWVDESTKDIAARKALAWRALNDMSKIWKSNMNQSLKKRFFVATVESILLYGCESWALTATTEKSLDGTYTRMLRSALNIPWNSFTTNDEVYGQLPRVTDKIGSRRLRLAGHCHRHPELSTQKLVLWDPTHGFKNRGGQQATFISTLKRDTGATSTDELASLMEDRTVWRTHVESRRNPP